MINQLITHTLPLEEDKPKIFSIYRNRLGLLVLIFQLALLCLTAILCFNEYKFSLMR